MRGRGVYLLLIFYSCDEIARQSASSRIYMYHNVLDLGKGLLYLIMNLLGNAMGSAKGLIAFYRNFQVDIHLIPKHSGLKQINANYLFLRTDVIRQFFS